MRARTPVLAADSGGPVETIREGITGWLRSPEDVPAWTDVVRKALAVDDEELGDMGEAGAARVRELFSRHHMAERFDELVDEIVAQKRPPPVFNTIVSAAGFALFFTLGLVATSLLAKK